MTETDEIATVLDEAQRRWPGESRQRLIVRVLLDWYAGGSSLANREAALDALIGSTSGREAYDADREWPA